MKRLSWAFIPALCSVACVAAAPEHAGLLDGEASEPPPAALSCLADEDCSLAAASCCECPSFAVPGEATTDDACSGIGCDPAGMCPAVEAACTDGACVMRCAAIACDISCSGGYLADAMGCLTCACDQDGPEQQPDCVADEDCVQVPADCCGCALGGQDTAIPAGEEQVHEQSLACPASPACPGVDTCVASEAPRCLAGTCALTEASVDGPPSAPVDELWCGRPDLPPCPAGTVCILNAPTANDATLAGVGICREG